MRQISILIFLMIFQFNFFTTYSQSNKDDVFTLINKAEAVEKTDPKKALDYLEQALNKSLKEGNKQGEAKCYSILGEINYAQELYSQSVDYYQKALSIYQSLGDKNNIIETRKNLGLAYQASNNYEKALEQFKLALNEASQLNQTNNVNELKYKIGNVYEKQGKYEDALKIYNEMLSIEVTKKNRLGMISANNSIGNLYLNQEKTKKALEHFEKSQNIAVEENNNLEVKQSYLNIGNAYRMEKNFSEELKVRKKLAEVNKEIKDSNALAEDYMEIGKIYLEQNAPDNARTYLEESEKISKKNGSIETHAETLLALSNVYKEKNDYTTALEYYQNYVSTKDSLISLKEKELRKQIGFKNELGLKQNKINLLEKDMNHLMEEEKFSKMLIYILSAGLFMIGISWWFIYQSSRKRRITNQVLALKSLRNQMNPHFIFNALNSVNNYISKNDERSANKYLSDFSKLMRSVMENNQHEFISLSTELNILQLYLSLEHSRFQDKFEYTLNVDEDIRADHIEIPPMLIQPYIENAVWHGLRYKEEKGFLKVNISSERENILKITIEDNGIGRKKSQDLKTINQKAHNSTGLKNTKNRLEIINELYNTKMKVHIEDLNLVTESGTKVTIYITPRKNQPL